MESEAEEIISWNCYDYMDIEFNQQQNEIDYLEGKLIIHRDY